jgi:hypothetical protein
VSNLAARVAAAVEKDARVKYAVEAVGEFCGDEQRRRDAAPARLRAELEDLLEKIREANAERKSQTNKLFTLFAELRGDVNDLRRTANEFVNRGPQVVVQSPPLRRLDN